jgi:hypothetical protein
VKRVLPVDAPTLAGAWILFSAFASVAGWLLSLAGQLNATGYAAAFGAGLAGAVAMGWGCGLRLERRNRPARYRRLWPAVFVVAGGLAGLGALLHAPNNIDAVTYRLPRVLHWLAAERWHWIDTVDPRLNYSGTGQEWLIAPQLALLHTDGLTWLPNLVGFLLLPGLLFGSFRALGVAGPVAARWMWLLPLAPVFVLQAGGNANDLTGAVYFVAALALGARAMQRRSAAWFALAVLAVALATGIKASNLPLVLPWLVFMWPGWRRLAGARRALLLVALPALAISAVPTLVANRVCSGDWTGDPANVSGVRAGRVGSALVGNTVETVLQNAAPPVFPGAGAVERRLVESGEPALRRWFGGDFPRFSLHVSELAQEEWAGLGLPILVLLVLGAAGPGAGRSARREVLGAGMVAALAFFLVMGSEMPARLLAAWYPLAAAAVLLRGGQAAWVRSPVFAGLAVVTVIFSLVPLLVSPSRPLVRVDRLPGMGEDRRQRAAAAYEVYARRSDPLAALRDRLPGDVARVGFMATADDSELSFWRPFGGRVVATVRPDDSGATWRARGIAWIAVRADATWATPAVREEWLRTRAAAAVATASIRTKVRRPPEEWMLVRIGGAAP